MAYLSPFTLFIKCQKMSRYDSCQKKSDRAKKGKVIVSKIRVLGQKCQGVIVSKMRVLGQKCQGVIVSKIRVLGQKNVKV